MLDKLKSLQRREKRSLSKIASGLLAEALSRYDKTAPGRRAPSIKWHAADMKARVDIGDKEALYRALDDR